jgi:aspartate aminotransferase/aminotransferase
MKEPGYQLTAKALEESIKSAYELAKQDNNLPKVVLLSNPSNPLGTIIPTNELKKIAAVLRKYPDLKIVIDEAYAEMCWNGSKPPSLLELAPDLRERMIVLRSATKALSAAGERMAMLMAFDRKLMGALRDKNIEAVGHPPRSAQIAYAYTMLNFTDKDKKELEDFYKPKVDYVYERVKKMGAAMPDSDYRVDGTFYVLCDLSDLLGEEIPLAAKRALGKTGKIETSEELVYSLLFQESLMVAPGSYFGMSPNNGFVRITCSGTSEQLKEMMDRIETRLLTARKNKAMRLVSEIEEQLSKLNHTPIKVKMLDRLEQIKTITDLKSQNTALEKLRSKVNAKVNHTTPEGRERAKQRCLAFFNEAQSKAQLKKEHDDLKREWQKFVEQRCTDGFLKNVLLNLTEEQKQTYIPWVDHLKSLKNSKTLTDIAKEQPIPLL